MVWIELEPGVFAEEADPDPRRILTKKELEEEILRLQQEINMYESELIHLSERKKNLEEKILLIQSVIGE
jgi:hypothetical protein